MIQKKAGENDIIILNEKEKFTLEQAEKVRNLSDKFIGRAKIAKMLDLPESTVRYLIERNRDRVREGRDLSPSNNCRDVVLSMRSLIRDTFIDRDRAYQRGDDAEILLRYSTEIRRQLEGLWKIIGSPGLTEGRAEDDELQEIFERLISRFDNEPEENPN
jgi:hypothetical protein